MYIYAATDDFTVSAASTAMATRARMMMSIRAAIYASAHSIRSALIISIHTQKNMLRVSKSHIQIHQMMC